MCHVRCLLGSGTGSLCRSGERCLRGAVGNRSFKGRIIARKREKTVIRKKIEIMLARAKKPPSVVQIGKLITSVDLEEGDGDIWGESDESGSEVIQRNDYLF